MSYSDSSSYDYKKDGFDSSQEECPRGADKHHRNKKWSSKSSKKSINLIISDYSSKEERKPKKKAEEAVVMCKYCKKYERRTNHSSSIADNKCMWNKKVVCFRYPSVCRQMGIKKVKGDKFENGNKDKWPKHKAMKDNKDD